MISSDLIEHDANCAIQELKFDEIEIVSGADPITLGVAAVVIVCVVVAGAYYLGRSQGYC